MVAIRVFYAVEFEDYIKNYIYRKQQIIKKYSTKGNYARKENIHLTMQFIGEIKSEEIEKLSKTLKNTLKDKTSFTIEINSIGKFERKGGDIVWFGVDKIEELKSIYNSLNENLHNAGFKTEKRPYKPHVTIGRKVIFNKDFKEINNEINVCKRVKINKISLMESTRIEGILKYVPKYSIILKDE